MTLSTNLERLRGIRQTEERQSGLLMESALAELRRIEIALRRAQERNRRALELVGSSVRTGEWIDRIAGIEETAATDRLMSILALKMEAAEKQAEKIRQEFLSKRIERRQVETLLEEAETQDALETKRKNQRSMDEWHRGQHRAKTKETTNAVPRI